jgi:hypothetical protein
MLNMKKGLLHDFLFLKLFPQERIPLSIDDFLYVCDGAYKHTDFTKMETNILNVVNFELGFPLSYRFLRRYARVSKSNVSKMLVVLIVISNIFYLLLF